MSRFEDLHAWQTARTLTNGIYAASKRGAFARDFGLRDQIRRAAVSVMSNVAEGFESRTARLYVDFLGRAKASAGEVRAQLYVALDQGYLSEEAFTELYDLADKASRQLHRLIAAIEAAPHASAVRELPDEYFV